MVYPPFYKLYKKRRQHESKKRQQKTLIEPADRRTPGPGRDETTERRTPLDGNVPPNLLLPYYN